MKTLLQIQTSLFGEGSQSSQLAAQFAANWQQRNPDGRVVVRDLALEPVPHLTAERFQAFLTPADRRTPEQKAAAAYSDTLIAELAAADEIVLAVPMYNFSVPSTLRSYFDHVARAGVTFRYTETGPQGLIQGKKAYAFITRGGVHAGAADTQMPYLRQFLAFIGITDVEFVLAEGLGLGDTNRQQSISAAQEAIAQLAPLPLAA
jgi:FMN-dependent NADH-azoreductase